MTCNIPEYPKDYCEIIEVKMDKKKLLEQFLEQGLE
jgi:hypothetical protein